MAAAVGRVAVGAVIGDGGMLPEEGAALVGVAFVAGVVDGGLTQKFRALAAMRRMAVTAGKLAGRYGMGGGATRLGAHGGMATVTGFRLGAFQQAVAGCVQGMATGAGQPAALVATTPPVACRVRFVAFQARFALGLRVTHIEDLSGRTEANLGERPFAFGLGYLAMFGAVAVTRLAGRCASIALDAVPRLINRQNGLGFHFIVASKALLVKCEGFSNTLGPAFRRMQRNRYQQGNKRDEPAR